jgi:peptidoglycan/xylan/chitin deacetylase (PgdA/CDA1 family)
MFNYKLLYKIFSILVIVQFGLLALVFVNAKQVPEQPQAQVSIMQNDGLQITLTQSSLSSSSISQAKTQLKIKLPILMYHHIDTVDSLPKTDKVGISLRVSPEIFEKQLQFLQKNNYNTVNSFQLQDYLDGKTALPTNPILLTFDDGYKDNYDNVLPLLKKYNMVGDFGIITSVIGTCDYMSWDQLKVLKNAGMSFASHTVSHCTSAIKNGKKGYLDSPVDAKEKPCSKFASQEKLTTGQLMYEYEQSKKELETNLGVRVSHLIYPMGFYNKQATQIAKDAGYSFATSVQPQIDNYTDFGNEPFALERKRVDGQQAGELKGFFAQ